MQIILKTMNVSGDIVTPFANYWSHKGHVFGHCLVNDTSDYVYVNIPKNATNWTKFHMQNIGFVHGNFKEWPNLVDNKKFIVFLRDPIDRWVSGIAEYFVKYQQHIRTFDNNLLDIIFDRVALDDHTEKQVYFLNGLEDREIIFFRCDNTLSRVFPAFLKDINIDYDFVGGRKIYATNEQSPQHFYKTAFTEILNQNTRYVDMLKRHYADDYNFINSIKFYGEN